MMNLEERLDQLERQTRRLKVRQGLLIAMVLSSVLLQVIRHSRITDVASAREFRVVDNDGTTLVLLGALAGSGMVATSNSKGQDIVTLTATAAGDGIVVTSNSKGQNLVRLGVTENDEGTVGTLNSKGQLVVQLGTTAQGDGIVTTSNSKGQDIVRLGAMADGSGTIGISNNKGQPVAQLSAVNGEGALEVIDPSGRRQSKLLVPGP